MRSLAVTKIVLDSQSIGKASLRKDKALFSIHTAYLVAKDDKDVFSYVEA